MAIWTTYSMMCYRVICLILILANIDLSTGSCPSDWKEYSGQCYNVSIAPATWFKARKFCNNKGANLTSMMYKGEKEFIASITDVRSADYWIGLTKRSGSWRWIDGNTLSYINWDSDEPDGSGKCVRILRNNMWRDIGCNRNYADSTKHYIYYICKKASTTTTLAPTTQSTSTESTKSSTTRYFTSTVRDGTTMHSTTQDEVTMMGTDDAQLVLASSVGGTFVVLIVIMVVISIVCVRRRKKAAGKAPDNDYTAPPERPNEPLELNSNIPVTNNASNDVYAQVNKVKRNPDDLHIEDNPTYANQNDLAPMSYLEVTDPAELYGNVMKIRTDPDELEIHDNPFYASLGE